MNEVQELSEKFQAWDAEIRHWVLERNKEVKGIVIATLAKAHHLQLGAPGTGKSYMVNTALELVEGAKVMECQLHGYSLMEDLYGPVSLMGLKEDRHLRKTDTYIPWCDFLFADELFKANPTLLQTNLWAFNERKFRNDGEIKKIDLITAFFASNEGPEDPELDAFDDRIHIRFQVSRIREPATRMQMFRLRLGRARQEKLTPVINIDDIRRAHELVNEVEVPDSVLSSLNEIQEELDKAAISVTDRKLNDALGVIQASAFYNGRMTATVDDLNVCQHMFWRNEKDIPVVAEKVIDKANPVDKKTAKLRAGLEKLAPQLEEIIAIESKPIRIRRSTDLHEKFEVINNDLLEIRAEAKAEGAESDLILETKQRLHSMTERLLTKGFGYNKNATELDKAELLKMIREAREERGEDPDGSG